MGSRHAPGKALQEVIHRHRGRACPKKGVTGDRESWGPCVPWEGCHRGWRGRGSVYDPGRALQDTGYRRARGCSRKGITGSRTSRVLQEGCCGGWGVSGSLCPPWKGIVRDKASQDPSSPGQGVPGAGMPQGPSASQEGPPGVCHSWEAVAQMHAVVCPSDGCGGFAAPTGSVGPSV